MAKLNKKNFSVIRIIYQLAVFFLIFFPQNVLAHSGRTDAYGCHNCYTDYCYGEYHCHGGGSYSPPVYSPPKPRPLNPTSGNINYKASANNWCNHDVTIDWTGASNATGFSVGISKSAGADPGPLTDTTSNTYVFTNITPGVWHINLKAINATYGTQANQTTYWTVTLPKIEPKLEVSLSGNYINYNFECLKEIEAPDFLIAHVKNHGNNPSGTVSLNTNTPQTLLFKGSDTLGKTYEKTLIYMSPTSPPQAVSATSTDDGDSLGWLVGLGIPSFFVLKRFLKGNDNNIKNTT